MSELEFELLVAERIKIDQRIKKHVKKNRTIVLLEVAKHVAAFFDSDFPEKKHQIPEVSRLIERALFKETGIAGNPFNIREFLKRDLIEFSNSETLEHRIKNLPEAELAKIGNTINSNQEERFKSQITQLRENGHSWNTIVLNTRAEVTKDILLLAELRSLDAPKEHKKKLSGMCKQLEVALLKDSGLLVQNEDGKGFEINFQLTDEEICSKLEAYQNPSNMLARIQEIAGEVRNKADETNRSNMVNFLRALMFLHPKNNDLASMATGANVDATATVSQGTKQTR